MEPKVVAEKEVPLSLIHIFVLQVIQVEKVPHIGQVADKLDAPDQQSGRGLLELGRSGEHQHEHAQAHFRCVEDLLGGEKQDHNVHAVAKNIRNGIEQHVLAGHLVLLVDVHVL